LGDDAMDQLTLKDTILQFSTRQIFNKRSAMLFPVAARLSALTESLQFDGGCERPVLAPNGGFRICNKSFRC
jgi:hypothetical protein